MNILKHEKYDHPHYIIVEDPKEADACAWVFVNDSKFTQVAFKFQELRSDEIRANVLYTGLCHSDSSLSRNLWHTPIYPVCPGHEIIAEVAMIGSEVKDFKIGEKVGFGVIRKCCNRCKMCKKNKEGKCTNYERPEFLTYSNYWGGWATQIQHPAEFFFKLPDNTDLQKAGPVFCAASTVYGPIKDYAEEGDNCLVIGIGGLGHYAIKILKQMGHKVTAFTHSKDKKDDLLKMGANEIIFADDEKNLINNKDKFDFVINTQPSFKEVEITLELCAPEAKYVMVGLPSKDDPLDITYPNWISKDVILVGSVVGSRKLTNEVLEFVIKNNLWPIVEEFKFEDFPKALSKMENSEVRYRAVVNVEEFSKQNGWFKSY